MYSYGSTLLTFHNPTTHPRDIIVFLPNSGANRNIIRVLLGHSCSETLTTHLQDGGAFLTLIGHLPKHSYRTWLTVKTQHTQVGSHIRAPKSMSVDQISVHSRGIRHQSKLCRFEIERNVGSTYLQLLRELHTISVPHHNIISVWSHALIWQYSLRTFHNPTHLWDGRVVFFTFYWKCSKTTLPDMMTCGRPVRAQKSHENPCRCTNNQSSIAEE